MERGNFLLFIFLFKLFLTGRDRFVEIFLSFFLSFFVDQTEFCLPACLPACLFVSNKHSKRNLFQAKKSVLFIYYIKTNNIKLFYLFEPQLLLILLLLLLLLYGLALFVY